MMDAPEREEGDEDEILIVKTTSPARNLCTNAETHNGSNHTSSLYQLPRGTFERRFRKEIIRALKKSISSFSRSLDDEGIYCVEMKLVEIQFKMFELYMAMYNEAVKGVKDILDSTTTQENRTMDELHLSNPLTWPDELVAQMNKDSVHIASFESYEFTDENIVETFRKELLPDFIETLLQLDIGEKLSHTIQYAVGRIGLHFVRFMVAMLKLIDCLDTMTPTTVITPTVKSDLSETHNDLSYQNKLGKKRSRDAGEDKERYSISKYILYSVGSDLLECLADILGADAFIDVHESYARERINGQGGKSNSSVLQYMPALYKSLPVMSIDGSDPPSYLNSSSNEVFSDLYHTSQIASSLSEKNDVPTLIEIGHLSLHLLAAARMVINSNAVKIMNYLLQNILEGQNDDDSETISIIYIKQMFRIYFSIFTIVPCIPSTMEASSQCHHQHYSTFDSISSFRELLLLLLDTVNLGKSVSEAKLFVDVLDIVEYRIICEDGIRQKHSVDRQVNKYSLYSGFVNVDEFYIIKISVLWRILTGINNGRFVKKATNSPSLQLQVFSLKTLMTWIQNIEEEIQTLEKRLHAIFSDDIKLNNSGGSEIPTIEKDSINLPIKIREEIDQQSYQAEKVEIILNQLNLRQLLILNHLKSEDHNFLRFILSSNAHSELLQRVQDLPLVFLRNNLLELSDLSIIWSTSGMKEAHDEQKHESITSAGKKMLLKMLKAENCWNTSHNIFLFHYIESLFDELDTTTTWSISKLDLLQAIMLRSIEVQKDTESVPGSFHLALKLSSGDGVKTDEIVSNGAFDCLKVFLDTLFMKLPSCSGHQVWLSNANFFNSVFEWIIHNFSKSSLKVRTTCSRLLRIIFSNIPVSHNENVRSDLNFRRHVCFGNLSKDFPFIFETLIQEALLCAADVNICTLDKDVYSVKDCMQFRKLLLQSFVRKCEDYLKGEHSSASNILRLSDDRQLDRLWILSCEAPNDEVAFLMVDYLATLYSVLKLPPKSVRSTIQQCISEFRLTDRSNKKTKRILRFLLTLTEPYYKFLKNEISGANPVRTHDCLHDSVFHINVSLVLSKPVPFTVSIAEVSNEVIRYSVSCQYGAETLLGSLRSFIDRQNQIGQPSPNRGHYRLVYRRRELNDACTTLKSVGITHGATIFCIASMDTGIGQSSNCASNLQKTESETIACNHTNQFNAKYLGREEDIGALFSLLTFDKTPEMCFNQEEINELGWRLLQRLPSERVLEMNIKRMLKMDHIQEGFLQKSFPTDIFRLCYALEILERVVIETNYFGHIGVDIMSGEKDEALNLPCNTMSFSSDERFLLPAYVVKLPSSITASALSEHFLQLIDEMSFYIPDAIEKISCSGEIPFTIVTYSKIVHFLLAVVQSGRCCVSKFQSIKFVNRIFTMVEFISTFTRILDVFSIEFKRYIRAKDELSELCAAFTVACLDILKHIVTSDKGFRAEVVVHFCRSSEVNGASILLQKALVSTMVGSNLDVVCFHAKSVFGYLFSPIDLSASSPQPDIASFLLSLLKLTQSKLLSNMKKFVGFKELHSLVFDIMSGMFKQFSKKQRDRSIENLIQRGFCGDVRSNGPLKDFCEIQSIEDIGNLFLYSFSELLEMLQCEHDYKESTDFSFDGCVEFSRKCIELFDCDVLTELVSKTDVNGKDFLCILTEMCFEWPMFGERRSRLLSLLSTLCLGMDSNMNFLMTKLEIYINILSPRPNLLTKWHSNENGNETELVGLKNQGATCYMNSLFQQLFYISDFRDRVLTLNLPINQIEISSSDNRLLHCLQDMFRKMLISRSQNFDTMELINVLPKNGESICVNEQQDVEEFLNMFTDRMESTLSSTADPNLMSDIFGGKLSHLITCKRCGFTSERIEDSRSISLDIRGHTSLESSLSGFIQEEFLNGDNQYFCSKCNERQDSMKRCCFNDLPKILVCHLKRFSFNLETLKRVKINDRFEFSTTLDLEPFTKKRIYANEDIESENLIYTLQGVIIHSGSSDSGHYYSLAKVQPSGIQKYGISTNLSNVKTEGWFCFNDTITTPFDMNSLEHEAFGGLNVKHNAYILVYAKNLREDQCQVTLHSQNWNPTAIIEENKSLAQSKILFSRQLEIFIKQVCTSEALPREMMIRAVRILSIYVFEFHVHSFTADSNEVLKSLSTLLHLHNCDSSLEAGFDFFRTISSSHQLYLEKMLLYCDHKELRGAFMHFISSLYDNCKKNRGKLDFIEDNGDEIEHCEFDCDDDVQIIQIDGVIRKRLGRIQYWKSNSVLERFKGCLFDLIDICVPHWRRCETLFEVLDVLARNSHEEAIWMIRSGVILRVLDIYLRDTSLHIPQTSIPRRKHNSNSSLTHKSVGHRRRKPRMKQVLSLLRTLVCSAQKPDTNQIDEVSDSSESENESDSLTCEIKSPARSPYLTENAKKRFEEVIYFLPIRDARILASKDFIQKLESERQEANDSDPNEVAAIIDQMINHLNF